MGSRCCDRLSCWLESEPCKNLSARLQTCFGGESAGTANEHKTATRIRPGSDQACCHAESNTNPEIQKWVPASDQKKTGRDAVFPQTWEAVVASPAPQKAQESRGQKRSTETLGTSQPSKTVNLNTTPTSMDLGDVVQTPARPPAVISQDRGSSLLALSQQQ